MTDSERMFHLRAGDYDSDAISVVRFEGVETVSKPFKFHVTFAMTGVEPRQLGDDLIGAPARLSFIGQHEELRCVQGVVRKLKTVASAGGMQWFRLTLVPRLWLLTRKKNSRIFQDQSVPEIAAALLDELGVAHSFQLTRTYQQRPYCVQYQETDLHFIKRLFAEEGIFYFFEDPPPETDLTSTETMVCTDAAGGYSSVRGDAVLPYRGPTEMAADEGSVLQFGCSESLRSDAMLLRYFDFNRPLVDFSLASEDRARGSDTKGPLLIYSYLYDLEEAEMDGDAAQIALEQERRKKRVCIGESRCRRLIPGHCFELIEHPTTSQCGQFVVTMVHHQGQEAQSPWPVGLSPDKQESYLNRFSCIPSDLAARPKLPKRRLQQVVETAIVVGPEGEEIHTDEHGRIKVQFHWDRQGQRNDRSSCWIRAMQPWAGPAWGFQFIPRVGMEVIVAFSGGDTDRPVVLGSLYNGVLPPPFPLPKSKTQSGIRTSSSPGGDGSNELRFEDLAGSEQVYLHAQRDLDEVVERDHSRLVRGQETVAVVGRRQTDISLDNTRTVSGNEVVTIEKNLVIHVVGSHFLQIDGDQTGDDTPPELLKAFEPALQPVLNMLDFDASTIERSILENKPAYYDLDGVMLAELGQLPNGLYDLGQRLEESISAIIPRQDELRKGVLRLGSDTEALLEKLEAGSDIEGDDPAQRLSERISSTRQNTAQLLQDLNHRLSEAKSLDDPKMAGFKTAALKRISGSISELQNTTGLLDDLAKQASAISMFTAQLTGTKRGGGGAISLHLGTEGSERDDPALIDGKETGGGGADSNIFYGNGGNIVSAKGYNIFTGGCSIQMGEAGGSLDIFGGTVNIKGGTVNIESGTVNIN